MIKLEIKGQIFDREAIFLEQKLIHCKFKT